MHTRFLLLASLFVPIAEAAPGPLDRTAPAAPLAYDSAFEDYRSDQTLVLADWKQSNAIGGAVSHAGHDMRHQQPDPHAGHDMRRVPQAMPKPQAAPAPDPHAAHHHP